MSRDFQLWASAFPLTRPFVKAQARDLFDLCAGFVYSQVLLACIELELLPMLASGRQSTDALASRLAMSPEATRRLLLAASSLKLARRCGDDDFALGSRGAMILGNPGIGAMVRHHAMLYADLRDPVGLLKGEAGGTNLNRYWSYASADNPAQLNESAVADYTGLMAASQPLVAAEILAAYRVSRHKCVLDVGGGDGTFLSAVAMRAPRLTLRLFDLPAVAERAKQRLEAEGHGVRTEVFGGDFRANELPTGADLITLIRVAYDHDDETVLALLRAVRRALPPDGVLLLAEPMSGTVGAEPIGDAYFGFYLLAMGSGRSRTQAELTAMLNASGFSRVKPVGTHTPMLVRLLVAQS